jgi:hypothetical protein
MFRDSDEAWESAAVWGYADVGVAKQGPVTAD